MTTAVLERIEAGEKRIANIFSDNYAFTIPPYQRPEPPRVFRRLHYLRRWESSWEDRADIHLKFVSEPCGFDVRALAACRTNTKAKI